MDFVEEDDLDLFNDANFYFVPLPQIPEPFPDKLQEQPIPCIALEISNAVLT